MSKPKMDRQVSVPDNYIKELLTNSELRMVKQRYLIVSLLEEGLSIRKIAARVKVGTDTVVRIIRMVESKNLRKTMNLDPKLGNKIKTKTPWIFGKSD